MRYRFVPLTIRDYDRIFSDGPAPRAGGIEDYTLRSPQYYRRGGGLFSFVKGIGKQILPFISKYILPGVYSVGSNVLKDMGEQNGSLRDSIKRRGMEGLKEVATKIRKGGKRKRLTGGDGGGGRVSKRMRYNLGVFT